MLLAASCGGEDSTPTETDPPPPDAGPECAPNRLLPGGACLQTGVPPEACAEGFEPDGQQGCNAILPAESCPDGMMAVPGDTACREVAPCPDAPYGDAPIEPTTEFVDGAYAGADSDGSIDKPWKTILEAVDAAEEGAVVAIAAGTYEEGIWSQGKTVRLWGRCPSLVEIVGTAPGYAAVELSKGDGAELHDLSISSVSFGVYVYSAVGVVLDRVHIHDTGVEGLVASGHAGPAEVSVRRSLVERATSVGIASEEAVVVVEESAVRDIQDVGADKGWGIFAQLGSRLTIRRSVSSGSWLGFAGRGSEATAEGVVVRDANIGIGNNASPEGPSTFAVTGSLIERYVEYGGFSDAGFSISGTVFRDAVFLPDGSNIPTAVAFNTGAVGTWNDSLVEGGGVGLTVRGATASVERVAVRDAALLGAVVIDGSTADIRSSTFERTTAVGVYVGKSSATLRDVIVLETAQKEGVYGDGVAAALASVDIASSRIESSARCGVGAFGGVVTLGSTAFECNAIHIDGEVYEGQNFDFVEGQGELSCGCAGEQEDKCQVQSSTLEAPSIAGVTD